VVVEESPTPSPVAPPVPSGPTPKHWKVLLDLREERSAGRGSPPDREAETVLKQVFADSEGRLKLGEECADEKFRPGVVSSARGAFTAPHARQVVYLINEGWCNVPESPSRLAVFQGGKMVVNAENVGIFLDKLTDLDGDGVQELVVSWYSARFGAGMTGTSLVRVSGDEVDVIKDFGQSRTSICEMALEEKGVEAKVLYYVPGPAGTMPVEFHDEDYAAPCPGHGAAAFVIKARDGVAFK
jgi:hypothetical protein